MTTKEQLTAKELETYNFCIKMGDTHELAMKAVEIARERDAKHAAADSAYRLAYES